jgi:hypothetical protein
MVDNGILSNLKVRFFAISFFEMTISLTGSEWLR